MAVHYLKTVENKMKKSYAVEEVDNGFSIIISEQKKDCRWVTRKYIAADIWEALSIIGNHYEGKNEKENTAS